MKKSLALAASLVSVGMLTASTIDWELPNLTDGKGNAIEGLDYTDIVFIYQQSGVSYDSASGKISVTDDPSGSNTLTDTDPLSGTWTDSNTSAGTYYMAYRGGNSTDGYTYYAISNGSGPATVAVSAEGGDPTIPGNTTSGSTFASNTFSDEAFSTGVRTVAPAVPEPATAALGLAGIAMLIRRRRQA